MQVLTAKAAAGLIRDGQTVACAGFVGAGHAEAVTRALEARFLDEGFPRDLTLIYAAGQGDRQRRGVNHFGHAGLVRSIIAGHWISAPRLGALVNADQVEAWNLPQGVIAHLFRAIAGGKPGVLTPIGLHTFVDPRHGGGRLSPRTALSALGPRVRWTDWGGQEQLFYPSLPIDVTLIRATTADEKGNLCTDEEPFHQDLLVTAQAARNSGGIVIAQVKRIVPAGTLDPHSVRVPGMLVDYLVVTEDPDDHWMTYAERHNEAYLQRPVDAPVGGEDEAAGAAAAPGAPLDARQIIQRRAFLSLQALTHPVINLGVGMPAGLGRVAHAAGYHDFTATLEAGPVGGVPADKLSFGASAYPQAVIDHAAMFDFYDGGGLDIAFLGMAELDGQGNVNVSRFGDRIAGVGGFINISQSTRRLVFMGSFTGDGLEVAGEGGRLRILQEGRARKIVSRVQHLSFNGPYVAGLPGREILYVTERAVFALREGRLTVVEIAPGIDLQNDVLAHCGTAVAVAPDLRTMDARIFDPTDRLAR
jgi:propionate CoA-transferase